MSYNKLLVCLSNSQFTARPISAFQICCRLSYGSRLREKKQKLLKVLFCFATKAWPHRSNSSDKVMLPFWIAGNLSSKVFCAACPIERKWKIFTFLPATSSAKPPIRAATRSPPSLRVNSVSETKCLPSWQPWRFQSTSPTRAMVDAGGHCNKDWGRQLPKRQPSLERWPFED